MLWGEQTKPFSKEPVFKDLKKKHTSFFSCAFDAFNSRLIQNRTPTLNSSPPLYAGAKTLSLRVKMTHRNLKRMWPISMRSKICLFVLETDGEVLSLFSHSSWCLSRRRIKNLVGAATTTGARRGVTFSVITRERECVCVNGGGGCGSEGACSGWSEMELRLISHMSSS